MQNFCIALRENGVTVLGIGDAPYETLSDSLRGALQEYYRVNDMENYDQMLRAVAYFTFKYGKIDYLESNNEYWAGTGCSATHGFQYYYRFEIGRHGRIQMQIPHEGNLCQSRDPCRPLATGHHC